LATFGLAISELELADSVPEFDVLLDVLLQLFLILILFDVLLEVQLLSVAFILFLDLGELLFLVYLVTARDVLVPALIECIEGWL
jgi:hypothetical protein